MMNPNRDVAGGKSFGAPAQGWPFKRWFFYLLLAFFWMVLKPHFVNPNARYWTPEIVMSDKDGVHLQEAIWVDGKTYARLNNDPQASPLFWLFCLEASIIGGGRLFVFMRSRIGNTKLAKDSSDQGRKV